MDEAFKVKDVVDAERYVAAVNVSFPDCPGVICRLVGETVTPDGSPETAVATGSVNPLEPVTVTVMVTDPPAATVGLVVENERLKSGVGAGGAPPPAPPPPQPQSVKVATTISA